MQVLIRADAGVNIGSGHVMRCLTLAGQCTDLGAEVSFVCREAAGSLHELVRSHGHTCFTLPPTSGAGISELDDAEATLSAVHAVGSKVWDWVVVDHYMLGAAWEERLRGLGASILAIDDLANRAHACDVLLDQNYYARPARRYDGLVPESCRLLLGPSHVLLRSEFHAARASLRFRDGSIQRVHVSFGGSDPGNLTEMALLVLTRLGQHVVEVDVVIGASNPRREHIQQLCASLPWASFHCQVANMSELISAADLAIGAGGASMWERCCLGLPTITVILADNQSETTSAVAETGAIYLIGRAEECGPEKLAQALARLWQDPQQLCQIGAAGLRLVAIPEKSLAEQVLTARALT